MVKPQSNFLAPVIESK